MRRKEKIQLVVSIILTGFVAAVSFHFCVGRYFQWSYPYDTFLFTPVDAFNDFFNFYEKCRHRNPYLEQGGAPSLYFPLADLIFYAFSRIPRQPAFVLYSAAFVLPLVGFSARQLRGGNRYQYISNVLICSLLTYPFLFTFDRGNNDSLVFVSLCAFVLLDDSRPILRSLLLAIPIAMKLYPGVFLVLLVGERRYKEAALTLVWVVLLSVVSLCTFKGGFVTNCEHALQILRFNERWMPFDWNNQARQSVGLFFPLKLLLLATDHYLFPITFWGQVKIVYRLGAMVFFVLLSLYVLFVERMRWKKVALLVFAMLLLPELSCDYRLIQILIPLFLLMNAPRQGKEDCFYVWMMALLLIPKTYYYLPGILSGSNSADISVGIFINPLIMIVVSTVIIVTGLRQWKARQHPTTSM